jgi:hypothetical protein
MRGLNTEIGHEVDSRPGLSRGPVYHQLLAEFFPVRGFSRLTGKREDVGVEDCIQRNNLSCSHDTTKQDEELRDRSLRKGRIVSHPGSSGMTRRGKGKHTFL